MMLRIVDAAKTIDMSRVERNAALYEELESSSRGSFGVFAGRLLSGAGFFLLILVLVSCLSLIAPNIAGYDSYVVVSGSMEPVLPVGCIVYTRDVDPSQLRMGDVIVFVDPSRGETPITHRVVSNDPSTQSIVTKGDANEHEDVNAVAYSNVIGIVRGHVPYLGYAAFIFSNVIGKIVAALLVIEAWLFTEIGRRLRNKARSGNRSTA